VGIEPVLARWGTEVAPAIAYSIVSPGKCLRGALLLETYRASGGRDPRAAELAAAVEVIHAYSLVHDDLPCMDDAALRRGRPATHRAFGVEAATRAGFAMVPLAAHHLARGAAALQLDGEAVGAIVREVFAAAGAGGMIGGQYLDLEAEGRDLTPEALEQMHRAKTGALITAACSVGGLAARANRATLAGLRGYGDALGLAFQIADDVLDAVGTTEEIGKAAGQDAVQSKATFVSALGVAGALNEAARHARLAVDALRAARISSDALEALATFVAGRRS
jgi:geranylgeranyl pyrophosphate synthase